jgi:TPR repeat protein
MKESFLDELELSYELGEGVEKKAFECYLVASKMGNHIAQFNLSIAYKFGEGTRIDDQKSFDWCLESANQNYANAMFRIAHYFTKGIGCKVDLDQAYYFYCKASESKEKISEDAQIKIKQFREKGLTRLSHIHHQKMYLTLSSGHEKIGKYNDLKFHF